MSRPRRSDLTPEILLPDDREQRRKANEVIDREWRIPKVRRRGERPIIDGFTPIMNEKQRQLKAIKQSGFKLDEGLVAFMMESCTQTTVTRVMNENGEQETRDGNLVFKLTRVGCRVYMTQEEIARQYGCSRQHVNAEIKKMKEHSLIVNSGNGWYEFAAVLCWRGDLDVQAAYRSQQKVQDGWEITDGTTTLVTENMDADDGGEDGEHPPPRCAGQGGENND